MTLAILGISLFSGISGPALALDGKAESGINNATGQLGGSTSDTLATNIKNIINFLLYIAGVAAVIVIVIAGIRFITSDGNPQVADKARNTIIYAAIGLILAVLSYAIVNLILDQLK